MYEFEVALKRAQTPEQEQAPEPTVEFGLAGQTFTARIPSEGLVEASLYGRSGSRAVWQFLEKVLLDDGYERLRQLVEDGVVPPRLLVAGDDLNDKGIISLIIEEASGRPTEPSTGSSPSQPAGGRRSTGRSPGKGSTASGSPSTAS